MICVYIISHYIYIFVFRSTEILFWRCSSPPRKSHHQRATKYFNSGIHVVTEQLVFKFWLQPFVRYDKWIEHYKCPLSRSLHLEELWNLCVCNWPWQNAVTRFKRHCYQLQSCPTNPFESFRKKWSRKYKLVLGREPTSKVPSYYGGKELKSQVSNHILEYLIPCPNAQAAKDLDNTVLSADDIEDGRGKGCIAKMAIQQYT